MAARPPRPCRHCSGLQFVRTQPREFALDPQSGVRAALGMTVTYETAVRDGVFEAGAAPIDPLAGLGILEQYVCARCGAVDWYCLDPEAIPIGPRYMTEEVEYEPTGAPYR